MDFQFDSTVTGQPAKILSIIEKHTMECLGGIGDYSIPGLDLQTATITIETTLRDIGSG